MRNYSFLWRGRRVGSIVDVGRRRWSRCSHGAVSHDGRRRQGRCFHGTVSLSWRISSTVSHVGRRRRGRCFHGTANRGVMGVGRGRRGRSVRQRGRDRCIVGVRFAIADIAFSLTGCLHASVLMSSLSSSGAGAGEGRAPGSRGGDNGAGVVVAVSMAIAELRGGGGGGTVTVAPASVAGPGDGIEPTMIFMAGLPRRPRKRPAVEPPSSLSLSHCQHHRHQQKLRAACLRRWHRRYRCRLHRRSPYHRRRCRHHLHRRPHYRCHCLHHRRPGTE